MSMSDALRSIKNKVGWLSDPMPEQNARTEKVVAADAMRRIVDIAQTHGLIDKDCSTWIAVSSWAANELLETFTKMETVSDEKAAALRSRAKVFRELLALNNDSKKIVQFEPPPEL